MLKLLSLFGTRLLSSRRNCFVNYGACHRGMTRRLTCFIFRPLFAPPGQFTADHNRCARFCQPPAPGSAGAGNSVKKRLSFLASQRPTNSA